MRAARTLAASACALAAFAAAAAPAGAAIDSGVRDRVLLVIGDAEANTIAVTCSAEGLIKVNGRDVDGGAVQCSKVVEVDVQPGDGNDVVDMSGVTDAFAEAAFKGFGTNTGAASLLGFGNDRYVPSPDAFNLVFGDDGNDRIEGGPARDLLDGGIGDDRVRGGDSTDTVRGDVGNDRLFGGSGRDTIGGGAGNDFLNGEAGADFLGGDFGRDRLRGGPGRDRLQGGPDKDSLNGGPGKDRELQDPGGANPAP